MNIALKYTRIDYTLIKKQIYMMFVIFAIASMVFITKKEFGFFASIYMSFAAMILSTVPFNIENVSESGFLDMLPSKTSQKILGRFFYSLSLCILAFIVQVIEINVGLKFFSLEGKNLMYMLLMILAVAIFICSLQNLVFYLIGRNNNRQLMSIISLVPGFVLVFGGSSILGDIESNVDELSNMINYFYNNIEILTAILLLISIIVFVVSVFLSTIIVEKRGRL